MNNPLISVIVPVYNVADYLPRCLDSICNQTYQNLEIILVDDGSTDNGLEICQQYAAKDKRIVVIHQANHGLSAARNAGMDKMHGEFFTFIDSDDWVEPNYCQILFQAIEESGADISASGFIYEYQQKQSQIPPHLPVKTLLLKEEESALFFLSVMICSTMKLFRTQNAGNLRFDSSIRLHEDVAFFSLFSKITHTLYYVPSYTYHYFQRSGSLMRSFRLEDRKKIFELLTSMEHYYQQKGFKKAQMCAQAKNLLYGCIFAVLSILEKPFVSSQELQKIHAWIGNNRTAIFGLKEISFYARFFMRAFYYCPRFVINICRLPGVRNFLRKLVFKRLLPQT